MPISKSGKPTEKLSFDEFLNSKSIHSLQGIITFWSSSAHARYSKSMLIRDLRRLMLDRKLLKKKVAELPPVSLSQLRCLIKRAPFKLYPDGQDVFIEQLAEGGFVHRSAVMARYADPDHTAAVIPDELKNLLIEVLDIDMRPVEEVTSLSGFLAAMPDERYRKVVGAALRDAPRDGTRQTDHRLLLDTQRILGRLRKLPEQLFDHVSHAVGSGGGLWPVELVTGTSTAKTCKFLEDQLIGTVTELPVSPGEADKKVMFVFTDVAEKLLGIQVGPIEGYDQVSDRGIGPLLDINTILQFLSLEGARVKQDNRVYRSSARRLGGLMEPTGAPADNEHFAQAHLTLLHKLGLTDEVHGEIVPTEKAGEWFTKEPEEQLAAILDNLDGVITPMNKYAWGKLIGVLRQLSAGDAHLTTVVLSRLLVSFYRDLGAGKDLSKLLYGFESLQQILDVAAGWLRMLARYGFVAAYLQGGALMAVKLTEPAAVAIGAAAAAPREEAEEQVLIVNPDFECIVFRHGPAWRVAATLSKFARRKKTDQTYHFKIKREHVEAAVLCGMSGDSMMDFLQGHSRAPVPQNVEYSVRDWASKVRVVRSFSAVILEAKDSQTLDMVMEDPQVKPHIDRRLSPTLAALKDRITNKKLINHLRQNGIFLKN